MSYTPHATAQPVTPLLVQLYDTHRLYKLAGDNAPEAKRELCEIVAGLLESSARPAEKELIADILISLIRQAERDLKRALADRLSVMDEAPLRLVLRLAEEEIGVAGPILRHSKVLNDLDLLYIIQSHDSPYWQVIAARENLHGVVSEKLAETRDTKTARVLAENTTAQLNAVAQSILADLACSDESIARPLLQRAELPVEIARRLYSHVTADLKAFIESEYDVKAAEIQENIADVIYEFTKTPDTGFKPSPAMLKAASLFAEKGQLNTHLMLGTLKRGQVASFVAQFSKFCGLPVSVVMSMLQQPQGQGLAISCKLHDVSRDDFLSMFLLTRRMVRNDGVVDHRDLNRAITYYDRITKELAQRLIRPCL